MYTSKDLKKGGIDLVSDELIEELDMEFNYMYQDELDMILKDYEHYLVFAYNCNWRGSNGYAIKKEKIDAFARDYDYYQKLVNVSKGNKACLLRESHHDVPMGHDVVIIGLTDNEMSYLLNGDFIRIEEFANKYRKMLKEKK